MKKNVVFMSIFVCIALLIASCAGGESPARTKFKSWLGNFKNKMTEIKAEMSKIDTNDMQALTTYQIKVISEMGAMMSEIENLDKELTEAEKKICETELNEVLTEFGFNN